MVDVTRPVSHVPVDHGNDWQVPYPISTGMANKWHYDTNKK